VTKRKAQILSGEPNEHLVGGTDLLSLYLERKDVDGKGEGGGRPTLIFPLYHLLLFSFLIV
jgi:hypothetical protein